MFPLLIFSTLLLSVSSSFNETLSRGPMYMAAAASYDDNAQSCVTHTTNGGKVLKQVILDCDYFHDKCSAFVYIDDATKVIGLGYRGSTNAAQIVAQVEESAFEKHVAFSAGGKVSKYFNDAFVKLWDGGIGDAITQATTAHPEYQCYVSGHSLGGAVASMAAMYMAKNNICNKDNLHVYTFGQPRPGDKTYATIHDQLIPNSYRVTHHKDLVAHIPPQFMNYKHNMEEIFYNNKMNLGDTYKECGKDEDDKCSDGFLDLSIDDHVNYYGKHVSGWGNDGCV